MNADVIAIDILWSVLRHRFVQAKPDARFQFALERLGRPAVPQEQIFQAGAFAVLAQHCRIAENLRHSLHHGNDLVPAYKRVEANREMRFGGETATDTKRKSG